MRNVRDLRDFSEKILNRALIRAEWIVVRERERESGSFEGNVKSLIRA